MTTEELRQKSLEQFAALRRKAMFEAQQNSPITMAPAAAAGASGGGSANVEPTGPFNFDITANWSLTTPAVVDEASFKTFLESGEDGDGDTNELTDVVITDFSLVGGRLRCNLSANGSDFYLAYIEVSDVNRIGNIVGLEYLGLRGNQIVTFDPSIPLPSGLTNLQLGENIQYLQANNTVTITQV